MYPSCSLVFCTILSFKSCPVSRWYSLQTSGTCFPEMVASTSIRQSSSLRQSLHRWAIFPRASACWSCSSDRSSPPSAQAAKVSSTAPPTCSGSTLTMIPSRSASALTCCTKNPISVFPTTEFPSKSKLWNCICRANSVVWASNTRFFRTTSCCCFPCFQRLAFSVRASLPVSTSMKLLSQLSRNRISSCSNSAGLLLLLMSKS
mmetsp:Transcript_10179/g.21728  ORF Transcript_10179/g.21728 Transcript_10179/m.21728 type:complete len:204 (-) Transcript_10179:511-1122(-)